MYDLGFEMKIDHQVQRKLIKSIKITFRVKYIF
jgi:hypothetical protein